MPFSSETDSALEKIDNLLTAGGMRRGGGRSKTRSMPAQDSAPVSRKGSTRKTPPLDRLEVIWVPGWLGPVKVGSSKAILGNLAWLVHGFSTRKGGRTRAYRPDANKDTGFDLNLGFTADDDPALVAVNRELFLRAVYGTAEGFSLVTLKQIHSTLVHRVERGGDGLAPAVLKGDGLMTGRPGLILGIQTADCLPVLLADKRNRAVAAFHAGWRGTLQRIVENGVGRMRLEFGSRPEDLVAAIGPGIGQCCYAVGEEVRHEFESQFAYASELFREISDSDAIKQKYPMLFLTARAPGHSNLGPSLHLDLAEANRRQLLSAGLKPSAIYLTGECTGCRPDRFFSHRSEQGFTGRMMSVIGIRGPSTLVPSSA